MNVHQSPNHAAIETWDTVFFDNYCRFRHLVTTSVSIYSDIALSRYAPAPGARVLDLGCGFGDTSLQLAKLVYPGEVVGVDGSKRFAASAERDAVDSGVTNVRFLVGDVQTADL